MFLQGKGKQRKQTEKVIRKEKKFLTFSKTYDIILT